MLRVAVVVLSVLLTQPQGPPGTESVLSSGPVDSSGPVGRCAPPRSHFRVMQYNIHSGRDSRGRLNLERTASVIERTGADVTALQEVDVHWSQRSAWRDQVSTLADRLGTHAFFAPVYNLPPPRAGSPERRFGLAVLSEHPVVSATNHPMTRRSTQHPENPVRTLPGFPEVVVETAGGPLHVYAAHLDHRKNPGIRRIQVEEITATLARDRPGTPQVLLGDLNASPRAPELAPLWDRLRDAAGRVGAPTYPAPNPEVRIDHVAVSSGVEVTCSGTVPSTASDHLPVLADLRIPVRGPGSRATSEFDAPSGIDGAH